MKRKRVLVPILLAVILMIGSLFFVFNQSLQPVEAPEEPQDQAEKLAVTSSEAAQYGIQFGYWYQNSTSEGVYKNNASAPTIGAHPAIILKGRSWSYYYASWMPTSEMQEVTKYTSSSPSGFPSARMSAPSSVNDLYWDDSGRMYFRGWKSTASYIPVYITPTMPTLDGADASVISKPKVLVTVSALSGGGVATGGASVVVGNAITVNAVADAGYSFAGWYTNAAFTGSPVSTSAAYTFYPQYATSLYARFTKNTYTITVNSSVGGTVSGGGAYVYQSQASLRATSAKGYTFSRWSDNNTSASRTITVTQSATYTAYFTANQYRLSYELNGGTGSTLPSAGVYGQSMLISKPTRAGYTFTGWTINNFDTSVAQSSANNTSFTTLSATNNKNVYFRNLTATAGATVTFTANWTVNSYKVTYHVGNGTPSITKAEVYDRAFLVNHPTRLGYTFTGWTITGCDTSVATNSTNGSTYTPIATTNNKSTYFKNLTPTSGATVTFTANWVANTYSVSYSLGGGAGSLPTSGTYDQVLNIKNPTRTGYTFTGWTITGCDTSVAQNSANGSSFTTLATTNNKNTYFKNLTPTSGAMVTFTANWKINQYAINVISSNTLYGKVTGGGTFNYGSNRTITATAESGYRFVGWYLDAKCTGTPVSTSSAYSFTVSASNVTIYAKFVQEGIHVDTNYTTSDALLQYHNLKDAIDAALRTGETEIYIHGSVGSLYENYNTFVNNASLFIKYTSDKELKVIGVNGNTNTIYNNAGNVMIDVQKGKITFENVTIYGAGASKTQGNRDNALLRVSGGVLVLGNNTKVTNSYNIGSGIHYAADWCPGVIDVASGILRMEEGSQLLNNVTSYGGDIFIHGGKFIMEGGVIKDATTMSVYAASGAVALYQNAAAGMVYLAKNVSFNASGLAAKTIVYADGRMNEGDAFGTTDAISAANIVSQTFGAGQSAYYLQGMQSGNALVWKKVVAPIEKSKLQVAIENASGKYTIYQGESISLATALGKYVYHVSGCLSIGSVVITDGAASVTGTGKRTTILGTEVGTITLTMNQVSTRGCYYYGTTSIPSVSITIQVLPSIGDVVEGNDSIAITNCNSNNTYILKNSKGEILEELTPEWDSKTSSYYVRFWNLTPETKYTIEASQNGVTTTKEVHTIKDPALIAAIKAANGFYLNVGDKMLLTNILGKYVYHLSGCINITDVQKAASNAISISGSSKATVIQGLNPGYVDITMKVKTNGWCAVYGTMNEYHTVTIRLYVLPVIPAANVAITNDTITLPAMAGHQYSIDGGQTWINASAGYLLSDLSGNTAYTILVGYASEDRMLVNSYTYKTKANPTKESLIEKSNQIKDQVKDMGLSAETIESIVEIINQLTNGLEDYSKDIEDTLDKLLDFANKAEALVPGSEADDLVTEKLEDYLEIIQNQTNTEIIENIKNSAEVTTNISDFITEVKEAETLEEIEALLEKFVGLSKEVQGVLTEELASLVTKYQNVIENKLEDTKDIPDLLDSYLEEAKQTIASITPETILDTIKDVHLVLDKASNISEIRGYEDAILGVDSEIFDTTNLNSIQSATSETLDQKVLEAYQQIAKEYVTEYAQQDKIGVETDSFHVDSIVKDDQGYHYNNEQFDSVQDAIHKAIEEDQKQALKKKVENLIASATQSVDQSALSEAIKTSLKNNLENVNTKYDSYIDKAVSVTQAENALSLVTSDLALESEKLNALIALDSKVQDALIPGQEGHALNRFYEDLNSQLLEKVQGWTDGVVDATTIRQIQTIVGGIDDTGTTLVNGTIDVATAMSATKKQYLDQIFAAVDIEDTDILAELNRNLDVIYQNIVKETTTQQEAHGYLQDALAAISFAKAQERAIKELKAYTEEQNIDVSFTDTVASTLDTEITKLMNTSNVEELGQAFAAAKKEINIFVTKTEAIEKVEAQASLTKTLVSKIEDLSTSDYLYFLDVISNDVRVAKESIITAESKEEVLSKQDAMIATLKGYVQQAQALALAKKDAKDKASNKVTEICLLIEEASLTDDQKQDYMNQVSSLENAFLHSVQSDYTVSDVEESLASFEADMDVLKEEVLLIAAKNQLQEAYQSVQSETSFSKTLTEKIDEIYETASNSSSLNDVEKAVAELKALQQGISASDFSEILSTKETILDKINSNSTIPEQMKDGLKGKVEDIFVQEKEALIVDTTPKESLSDFDQAIDDYIAAWTKAEQIEDATKDVVIEMINQQVTNQIEAGLAFKDSYEEELQNLIDQKDLYTFVDNSLSLAIQSDIKFLQETEDMFERAKIYATELIQIKDASKQEIGNYTNDAIDASILTALKSNICQMIVEQNTITDVTDVWVKGHHDFDLAANPDNLLERINVVLAVIEEYENMGYTISQFDEWKAAFEKNESAQSITEALTEAESYLSYNADLSYKAPILDDFVSSIVVEEAYQETMANAITSLVSVLNETSSMQDIIACLENIQNHLDTSLGSIDELKNMYENTKKQLDENHLYTYATGAYKADILENLANEYNDSVGSLAVILGETNIDDLKVKQILAEFQTKSDAILLIAEKKSAVESLKAYANNKIDTNSPLLTALISSIEREENSTSQMVYEAYQAALLQCDWMASAKEELLVYEQEMSEVGLDISSQVNDVIAQLEEMEEVSLQIIESKISDLNTELQTQAVTKDHVSEYIEDVKNQLEELEYLSKTDKENIIEQIDTLLPDGDLTVDVWLSKKESIDSLLNGAIVQNDKNAQKSTDEKKQIIADLTEKLEGYLDGMNQTSYPQLTENDLNSFTADIQTVINDFKDISFTEGLDGIYEAYEKAKAEIADVMDQAQQRNESYAQAEDSKNAAITEIEELLNQHPDISFDYENAFNDAKTTEEVQEIKEQLIDEIEGLIEDAKQLEFHQLDAQQEILNKSQEVLTQIDTLDHLSIAAKNDISDKVNAIVKKTLDQISTTKSKDDLDALVTEALKDLEAEYRSSDRTDDAVDQDEAFKNAIEEFSDASKYFKDHYETADTAKYPAINEAIYKAEIDRIFASTSLDIQNATAAQLNTIVSNAKEELQALEAMAEAVQENVQGIEDYAQAVKQSILSKELGDEMTQIYNERVEDVLGNLQAMGETIDLEIINQLNEKLEKQLSVIERAVDTFELTYEREHHTSTLTDIIKKEIADINKNVLLPSNIKEDLLSKFHQQEAELEGRLTSSEIDTSEKLTDAAKKIEDELLFIQEKIDSMTQIATEHKQHQDQYISLEIDAMTKAELITALNAINDATTKEGIDAAVETNKSEVAKLLEDKYAEKLQDLKDATTEDETTKALDTLELVQELLRDIASVDKKTEFVAELETIIGEKVSEIVQQPNQDSIGVVKALTDTYEEVKQVDKPSLKDYLVTELQSAIDTLVEDVKTSITNGDYEAVDDTASYIQNLVDTYYPATEAFQTEEPKDYTNILVEELAQKYESVYEAFEEALSDAHSEELISSAIDEMKTLNNLLDRVLTQETVKYHKDQFIENILPSISEAIENFYESVLQNETFDGPQATSQYEVLLDVYHQETALDTKYDAYVVENLQALLDQKLSEFLVDIKVNRPGDLQISPEHIVLMDEYLDLVDKYEAFGGSVDYVGRMEEQLVTIMEERGTTFANEIILGKVDETSFEEYTYANQLLHNLTGDDSYDFYIQSQLIDSIQSIQALMEATGSYYEDQIDYAVDLVIQFGEEILSCTSRLGLEECYDVYVTSLKEIPIAQQESLSVLEQLQQDLISGLLYTEESLQAVEQIIEAYIEATEENQLVYFVDAALEQALEDIAQLTPYRDVKKQEIEQQLNELVGSNVYYEDQQQEIKDLVEHAIDQMYSYIIQDDGSNRNVSTSEIDVILAQLQQDLKGVAKANEIATVEVEEYFSSLYKKDYTPVSYEKITNLYQQALDDLKNTSQTEDVTQIVSNVKRDIQAVQTIFEQSFTKIKAEYLESLEGYKDQDEEINAIIDAQMDIIGQIKPTETGKNELTEAMDKAVEEITIAYKEKAKEELDELLERLVQEDYFEEEWNLIEQAILDAKENVSESSDISIVLQTPSKVEDVISSIPTKADKVYSEAVSELEQWKSKDDRFSTTVDEYLTKMEEATTSDEITTILTEAKEVLQNLEKQLEVEDLLTNLEQLITDYEANVTVDSKDILKAPIDAIVEQIVQLDDQALVGKDFYENYELLNDKLAAKAEIIEHFNELSEELYTPYQYQKLQAILATGLETIDEATQKSEVLENKDTVINLLDAIPTILEETLDASMEEAIDFISDYIGFGDEIDELIGQIVTAIEAATTPEDVNRILQENVNELFDLYIEALRSNYPEENYFNPGNRLLDEIYDEVILEWSIETPTYHKLNVLLIEAKNRMDAVEDKQEIQEKILEALAIVESYLGDTSSEEINGLVLEYSGMIAEKETILDVQNTLNIAVNALEKQKLQEAIEQALLEVATVVEYLDSSMYTQASMDQIYEIYGAGTSKLDQCQRITEVDKLKESILDQISRIPTRIDTAKDYLDDYFEKSESNEIKDIIHQWQQTLDGVTKNEDGSFSYEGSEGTYPSLEDLIVDVLEQADLSLLKQLNQEAINQAKKEIEEKKQAYIDTKKYSHQGQSELDGICDEAWASLDELDLELDTTVERVKALQEQAYLDYKGVFADSTYTQDGNINKENVDDPLDYDQNHDFSKEGYWGNVVVSTDALQPDVSLVIEKQKEAYLKVAQAIYNENKAEYEQPIKLENSEIKSLLDIYLVQDKVRIQVEDEVIYTVRILLPEEYRNTRELSIIHIADDGTIEFFEVTIQGNCLVFETAHFSDYAIVGMTFLEQKREEQTEQVEEIFQGIDASIYEHAQWQMIRDLFKETLSALQSQTITAPEMEQIVLGFSEAVAATPTELEMAQKNALEELEQEFKSHKASDYSASEYQQIVDAYNKAKKDIQNAQTLDAVEQVKIDATRKMSGAIKIGFVVGVVVGSILGAIALFWLLLFIFYFKLKLVVMDGKEEKVVLIKRTFWLVKIKPSRLALPNQEMDGVYVDENKKQKATDFRMPFGRVKLYVTIKEEKPKQVKKVSIPSAPPKVVPKTNSSKPNTPKINLPKLQKQVYKVSAEEVSEFMSDEDVALLTIKKEIVTRKVGKKAIVNIDVISKFFKDNETVTLEALKAKKLVDRQATQVKVLARGILDKPLIVKADSFSKDAIKMIVLTGGEVIITVRK